MSLIISSQSSPFLLTIVSSSPDRPSQMTSSDEGPLLQAHSASMLSAAIRISASIVSFFFIVPPNVVAGPPWHSPCSPKPIYTMI